MLGSLRNALLAGLIAAVGMFGVSYAATGSLNPANVVSHGGASSAAGSSLEPGSSDVSETGSSPVSPTADHGPERSTEGCDGFTGNHGQFVSQSPEGSRSDAAHSDCGKPVQSVDHKESVEHPTSDEHPDADDNPGVEHQDDDHGQDGQGHGQSGESHGNSEGQEGS
jgi:hypothetical protein